MCSEPEWPLVCPVPILPEVRPHLPKVIVLTVMVHMTNGPLADVSRVWQGIAGNQGVGTEVFFNEFEDRVTVYLGAKLTWASVRITGGAGILVECARHQKSLVLSRCAIYYIYYTGYSTSYLR